MEKLNLNVAPSSQGGDTEMKENNKIFKTKIIRNLDMLEQECAEVIQICTKIKKFGPDNYNPSDQLKTKNKLLLLREIGDLSCAITMAATALQLDLTELPKLIENKKSKLKQFPEVKW